MFKIFDFHCHSELARNLLWSRQTFERSENNCYWHL